MKGACFKGVDLQMGTSETCSLSQSGHIGREWRGFIMMIDEELGFKELFKREIVEYMFACFGFLKQSC